METQALPGGRSASQDSADDSTVNHPGLRVAIVAARDSQGVTSLAVNLSVALAQETSRRVALIDYGEGDAALMLNLQPDRGFAELFDYASEIDDEILSHFALGHPSGVVVFPSRVRPIFDDSAPSAAFEMKVTKVIVNTCAMLVADLPLFRLHRSLELLKLFDGVLVVTTAHTFLEIRATRCLLEGLAAIVPEKPVMVILNRREAHPLLSNEDVEKHLGCRIFATIPNDSRVLVEAITVGSPVLVSHPRSALAGELRSLALQLLGRGQPATQPKRFSLFNRRASATA